MKYHENNQINNFVKNQISSSNDLKIEVSNFISQNPDLISEESLSRLIRENQVTHSLRKESSEKVNSDFEELLENSIINGYVEFSEIKDFIENGMNIDDIISKIYSSEIKILNQNSEMNESDIREMAEFNEKNEKPGKSSTVDGMSVYMRKIGENPLLDKNQEIEIFKSIEESREKYAKASMSCILTLLALEKMNNYFDRGIFNVSDYIEGLKSLDEKHYSKIKINDENDDEFSPENDFEDLEESEEQVENINQKEITEGVKVILGKVRPLRIKMEEVLSSFGENSEEYNEICEEVVQLLSDVRFSQKAIQNLNNDISKIVAEVRNQESKILEIVKKSKMKSANFKKAFINNETNFEWYTSLNAHDLALIGTYIPEINNIQKEISLIIKPSMLSVKKIKSINAITVLEDKNISKKIDYMVKSNLRLVVSCAKKYYSFHPNLFEDFIQEGNIGLMKAVSKFIYRKGFKFSTYAVWWIKQSINGTIQGQSRTVRIPIYMNEQISKINKIQDKYIKENGHAPKPSYIAEKMDMPLDKVQKVLLNINKISVSMDAPIGESDEAGNMFDILPDNQSMNPVDILENEKREKAVKQILSQIRDERAAEVLMLRFGIGINHSKTLEEIGELMDLTRERIRQIEVSGLKQLKSSKYIDLVKDLIDMDIKD